METVVHSDHSFATVAFLKIKSAHLEEKHTDPNFTLRTPPLLCGKFEVIRDNIINLEDASDSPAVYHSPSDDLQTEGRILRSGNWISICGVQTNRPDITLEEEMRLCFSQLEGITVYRL